MHIPKDFSECEILKFKDALKEEQSIEKDYDSKRWLYVPCRYSEYRYILGTKGKNPLICIGINPSTAEPDNLDNTLKSVERLAAFNGYDSFIMFNVYPQRATDPNDMSKELNEKLHTENMQAFEYILSLCEGHTPSIWAAWGTIIEKRPYLKDCVRSMIEIGERYNAKWYTLGTKSKSKGHPHHPLYLKKDTVAEEFCDIMDYLNNL
ncbi:MAG: DUF1643 domain-containing protein [Ruminococcaceae bacterium]|nr:DUF1643 domain-containing protein [Oscillospiraceae bacterium]